MPSVRVRPDLDAIPAYRPGLPVEPSGTAPRRTFKCSSNENPFPPLPGVLEAITAAGGEVNRYPDMACTGVTCAVAERLGVPAAHVVFGPGSVGVLQQLVTCAAAPGDEVVFAWRSFEAYPIVTQVAGATPVPVPLARDGRHDVDALAAAVTDRTRVVLVCSPNNPTGPVVSAAELARLLDAVPDDVLVVVDEAYGELVRDPEAADGLAEYRRRSNVAVLRTFSKTYGLAGLRIGYAIADEPVATALRKTSVPFGVSSIAQAAAVESLRQQDALLARVDTLVAQRERVVDELATQGWDLPTTQANFVWFPLGQRAVEFAQACEAAGIAVRAFPGEGVRVTIAEPEANDILLEVSRAWLG